MNKPRANRVKGKGRALNIPPFLFLFLRFQSATHKIGRQDLLNTHVHHRLKLIWITKVHFSALCVYIYLCVQPNKKKKSNIKQKTDLTTNREDHQSVSLTMVRSLIFTRPRFFIVWLVPMYCELLKYLRNVIKYLKLVIINTKVPTYFFRFFIKYSNISCLLYFIWVIKYK